MTNQLQKLAKYVSKFKKEVKIDFDYTDEEIKTQAEKVMTVIGDAISREAVIVDKSFAENKKAVAALHALVIASTDSLKELVGKLDVEEKEQVLQFMKSMEARHVEIVSYLSDGGLDKVANVLAASMTPEGFTSHEGFEPVDLQSKLKTFGLDLTPEQLSALHDGIVLDTVTYKMSPKESIYVRLSQLAPVVATAKLMKAAEIADKKQSEHTFISNTVGNARTDIFNRIQELDIAHREAIRSAAADLSNNLKQSSNDINNHINDVSTDMANKLNSTNSDVINRLNSVSADIVNADKSSSAEAINNLKGAINSMSADVKSAVVAASNDITGKTSSSLTAATTNINDAITTSAANINNALTSSATNLKSSLDNNNVTTTNIFKTQDAAITEARKWSTDNLTNLNAIKDAITKIQSASTSSATSTPVKV